MIGTGRRLSSVGAVIAVASIACGAATASSTSPAGGTSSPVTRLGSGAAEVWIFRPSGPATAVVVFAHGWSTPTPAGFAGWISHLRNRGSIVIYPRYQTPGESTAAALSAFRRGLVTAFRALGRERLPVVAIGKSFGGSAVFDYAAQAPDWGVPRPKAVLSVFPAGPIGGALPHGTIPATTQVTVMVGDRDIVAGRTGADAFWRWLSTIPAANRRYVVVRSAQGFAAVHDAPQRTDEPARRAFWAPLDAMIARAVQAAVAGQR